MTETPSPTPSADGTKTALPKRKSSRRRKQRRDFDRRLADLADRQYGLVALWQLSDLDQNLARQRAIAGSLHRVQQGVYTVGHSLLPRNGHLLAAVLACGPDAVLSHRSAAVLHGLLRELSSRTHVIAPNRRGRSPSDVAAHRDGTLTVADQVTVAGIPCTSVARTLLDLAGSKDRELRYAITQAEVERKFDLREVEELLKRSKGRRGVRRLKLAISLHDPREQLTRRELEARILDLCWKWGLPLPEVNGHLVVDGISVMPDFIWRDAGLIVEADSRRVHGTVAAFEKDRRRDQLLTAAGWTVIRCTWRQVLDEPEALAGTVRTILSRSHSR